MRTAVFLSLALVMADDAGSTLYDSQAVKLQDVIDLSLMQLESPAADASNRWADQPAAAQFGHRLFFDPRLSANGAVSCASCHDPSLALQDSIPLGKGVGTTERRTMPIAGTAHAPFLFWDGRKDSQWAQALGPLESAVEHGGSRAQYAHVIANHYRREYESLFGPLPQLDNVPAAAGPVTDPAARTAWAAMSQNQREDVTQVFVNIGKAIAAYERQLHHAPARFDRFVAEWQRTGTMPKHILDANERAGLTLFVGKANCTQCHNGPLFTNHEFHNTGVPLSKGSPRDRGRFAGVAAVQADEFNCRSRWSDAQPDECLELDFLAPASAAQERAFKVPSLRDVAERAPYMHAGQFSTLKAVLDHYNRAPKAPAGRTELKPLHLSDREIEQLEAFLRTLSGGLAAPAGYLAASSSSALAVQGARP